MSDPESIQSTQLKYGGAPQAEVEGHGFMYDMTSSDLEKIKKWIDDTDPNSVRNSGVHYAAAGRLLEGIVRELDKKRAEIADYFQGPADAAMHEQLRSLDANMRELGDKLGQMGGPLKDYADTLDWAKANVVDSRYRHSNADQGFEKSDFVPFFGVTWSEDRARNHLEKVNERISEHYERLPSEVRRSMAMPKPVEPVNFQPAGLTDLSGMGLPNGLGTSGTGDGQVPPYGPDQFGRGSFPLDTNGLNTNGLNTDGLNADGPGLNGSDLNGSGLNGSGLNGSGLNGSDLNGVNPSLSNVNMPNTSLSTPNMPNLSATDLSLPDSGTTRLAGLDNAAMTGLPNTFGSGHSMSGPSGTGTSTGTGAGAGSGTGTGGLAAGATGATGGPGIVNAVARTGTNGMSMMPPMMPGRAGGGEGEQVRENESWLKEDDDVWGDGGPTTSPTLA
ncbi:hypothetical protein AB0M44_08330 [Streptosporangium subroseum]|uniref:hypothetical protein n=1 Tax=Streptosporangium subroseum TaxID=106412 RepID=UPI003431A290